MEQPKTRYARNGEVSIAYQVVGVGPIDVVVVPGFVSHLDLWWAAPESTAVLRRLSSFARLILFDKRGTGLSDPVAGMPTLEDRMEDLHAVLDAAGSGRPTLVGVSEGGPMSILFAATYPGRVRSLVLYGTFPTGLPDPDRYPPELCQGMQRTVSTLTEIVDERWGEGQAMALLAPSVPRTPAFLRAWGLFERAAASPGMAHAVVRAWGEIDVADVLGALHVPTLVLHRLGDGAFPVEGARYLAAHIPGARLVELPGVDHIPFFGDADALLDEIEEFVTGARQGPEPDRALATVMFTDIVGSTERAAELGDRRWRDLLEAHHALVRDQLVAYGGREVKTLGDGFLAAFDGPAKAIRCAGAILERSAARGVEVRVGIHTGECELMGEDLGGMAVHIGARIAATAQPGEVLVSSTVKDLVVGSGFQFTDRGLHRLKGVPGEWRLLAVADHHSHLPRAMPGPRSDVAPNAKLRRLGDRTLLRLARRAPGAMRLMSRAARGARRHDAQPPDAVSRG